MFPARNTALFLFGRRQRAIGLAGVALCHDVLIVRTLARARRRLGLAFLAAMLAAHVGLAFEVIFTRHMGQCTPAALVRNADAMLCL
ncbi:hypothetical protein ABIB94_008735 [Bradyrhizobium sp. JR7.2]|uniref:Uncharacterized protein n=1 Tax=Bradyrhizobium barranii TaxID=2992140 RepID=A0ABY3QR27_9BRAD|nr:MULTISPECIES: hypothetical protein [Bradyrhizobium]UFW87511.1 hypothetical protein BjapCC829_02575 [Bradyrhizobium japonicum]WFT96025.1 hypothetical protein QA633_02565 [Bradyrhizobium barranii]